MTILRCAEARLRVPSFPMARIAVDLVEGGHGLFAIETAAGRTVVIRQNDGAPVPAEGDGAPGVSALMRRQGQAGRAGTVAAGVTDGGPLRPAATPLSRPRESRRRHVRRRHDDRG